MLRWNGVRIENPGYLPRPSARQAFHLRLEHAARRWERTAWTCVIIMGMSGAGFWILNR